MNTIDSIIIETFALSNAQISAPANTSIAQKFIRREKATITFNENEADKSFKTITIII